ncbi:hypothetical protein HPG69_002343 [Diceros bicornis minor]|uniref:Nbr1 FW domain-containing protein n=1 Tax=Diceros bicornis minor TaxID=77932 RepID=A0A7J7FNJ1_DICBM|nr:hypothetical protein HPG69_002343 [Diceros bicornis minor]
MMCKFVGPGVFPVVPQPETMALKICIPGALGSITNPKKPDNMLWAGLKSFLPFLFICRNLQAAIGAYYDFESPNINVPSMSFVEDVTIGEGESIPPDTQFIKTWRIQNSGTEAWPPGVCLKYVGGDQFGHVNMVMVRSLEPQEIADVSVQMCSPSRAGMYQGQWRMCTATGLYYGASKIFHLLNLRNVLPSQLCLFFSFYL